MESETRGNTTETREYRENRPALNYSAIMRERAAASQRT